MAIEANLNEELSNVDERIAELKKLKEFGEALERLHDNPDFQLVILDGYFEVEADRVFRVLTTPMNMRRDSVENTMDKLTAVRELKQYFGNKLIECSEVDAQIAGEEEFRKEVTANAALVVEEDEE